MTKTLRRLFPVPLTVVLVLSGAYLAVSHSRLFVDPFIFDDTLENRPIALERFYRQAERAAASAFDGISALAVATPCVNGQADAFPCDNVDLLAFVPKAQMGGGSANTNDIWGWTDPVTGQEIAILGRTNGTSFVDVTAPTVPRHLGFLPSHNGGSSSWRDIKVFANHAFIVADQQSTHGLQVFDLRQLRTVTVPQTFSETAHFGGFGSAHNVVINEDTAFAYAVGSDTCSGGLYTVNISNPLDPQFAGCFAGDGYVHDAQCVVYTGPDTTYFNREICFGYNEDTLTVVDVDNKSNPVMISRTPYSGSAYTHQGWLTPDQRFAISNDELDESRNGVNTTTFIWDLNDLDNPFVLSRHTHSTSSIDHNLYIHNGHVYESNYRAGLRILSIENVSSGTLEEVAFFDVIPGSDSAQFSGTWSNYPYFASGTIILSDIGTGLFVVKANLTGEPPPPPPPPPSAACAFDESFDDVGGFTFIDDGQTPQYSDGSITGGAATAVVGGVDNADISDMEAVWRRTCTADEATGATVTVVASMDQSADYESSEFSQLALRVNGGSTVFATLTGNGNGGGVQTTGLQTFTASVSLAAGENTIDLVCFNNLKTFNNESTSCRFDRASSTFGGGGTTTVFEDDFESASGWVTNPAGTDTATTGQWERANPQNTSSSGPKQLGTTVSGSFDLVTAGAAGTSVGTNDIDNGATSARSPDIAIPTGANVTLTLSYYMAHTSNSSNADFFRVSVVTSAGASTVVLEERGASNDDDAAWEGFSTSLNAFSGQVIHLLVEAADAGGGSIVEAAIDDVRITAQ